LSLVEASHVVRDVEPPGLGTVDRRFRGDITAIVSKALEKESDRRYASASELAADLRRHLRHEPVLARPAGRILRLRRWARRNPALATALGALAAVLIIGLATALLLLDQKAGALAQVTSERNEKRAALADYDRLGDLSRLRRLVGEADRLWPAEPSNAAAMRSWVEQASDLEERLPGHQDVVNRLRMSAAAIPINEESRAAGGRPQERVTWRFGDASVQFKHDTTAELVADLTAFLDPKRGLLAQMRARLAFAELVERETIGKHESRWANAIRSIADENECPKYGGLKITPQLGLIPIAKDPDSGLWEFSHLQTTEPGTDPIPRRGANRRLVVTGSTGLVFVLLPGGTFRMGATKPPDEDTMPTEPNVDPQALDNESPVTQVTIGPFFLSKYEMTQGQWVRIVGTNPSHFMAGTHAGHENQDLRNPVEQVSWEDCDFWLGRLGMVLPTEAQWEYAARGGTTTPWWTGIGTDGLATAANLADECFHTNGGPSSWKYESWSDGFVVHAPVGSLNPNPFGLHDVLGNVWEWCRDWFAIYGSGILSRDRTYRGGGWRAAAWLARSAFRGYAQPGYRDDHVGVRPAMALRPN
jgi:formylglycine-generating enzyme required for sulfatase activity